MNLGKFVVRMWSVLEYDKKSRLLWCRLWNFEFHNNGISCIQECKIFAWHLTAQKCDTVYVWWNATATFSKWIKNYGTQLDTIANKCKIKISITKTKSMETCDDTIQSVKTMRNNKIL